MSKTSSRYRGLLAVVVFGVSAMSFVLFAMAADKGTMHPAVEYSADGKLKRPLDHRKWIYIGTPLTPNDLNDGEAAFPEFHAVYMDPESFAHYEKTGQFRDGTTLVKELISVGSKEAPSGNGYFMGDLRGLDVAVKDSQRFKDEPGSWAYFNFNHKLPLKTEAVKSSAVACNKCHQDNATKDWVFMKYYPVLRDATPASK
jgi:hypothetical protein